MDDVPFLFGWKVAEVVDTPNGLRLRSGTAGVLLERDAWARCFKHPEHDPPTEGCSCGFFASTAAESLVLYARYPFSQLLEVELSGRTIRAETSLRAERQRVLRVLLLPTCYQCGGQASLLGEGRGAARFEIFDPPALTSMCEDCAGARWWLRDDVEAALGVPVSWALPAEALVLHGSGMNLGDH